MRINLGYKFLHFYCENRGKMHFYLKINMKRLHNIEKSGNEFTRLLYL